jgi:uroporphyrinogen decarboxylase
MKKMTSLERCMAALKGKIPDRVPVIPQCFMFACETAGFKIGQINKNGKLMAQSHIISQEKYGYDGCVIDIDDASLAEACGAKVLFREDDVAVVDEHNPLLKNLRDIDNLKLPDPYNSARLPEWLEATRVLKEKIGDHIFIMGRADQGPFDLICLLRGTEKFMMDLIEEDENVIHHALDWCREANLRFSKAQKDAGAHVTSIGDAYASPNLISPDQYRQFALNPEIKLTKQVQDYGIPFSIHICGNTTSIIADMVKTGAKILELDWQTDLKVAKAAVGNKAVIMGNINPSDPLVFGTPEQVDAASKKIIEDTKGTMLYLSSGCAMGRNTKHENMIAMVEAPKKYGTYDQIMEMNK